MPPVWFISTYLLHDFQTQPHYTLLIPDVIVVKPPHTNFHGTIPSEVKESKHIH